MKSHQFYELRALLSRILGQVAGDPRPLSCVRKLGELDAQAGAVRRRTSWLVSFFDTGDADIAERIRDAYDAGYKSARGTGG